MFHELGKSCSRSRASAANSWVLWPVSLGTATFRGSTGQSPTPYSLMDLHLSSMRWEWVGAQLVPFSCASWMDRLLCHWDRLAEVQQGACRPPASGPSLLLAASRLKFWTCRS